MDAGALALIDFIRINFESNTLDGNFAAVSGGAFLWALPDRTDMQSYIYNCTFTGNIVGFEGGAMHISKNNVSNSPDPLLFV